MTARQLALPFLTSEAAPVTRAPNDTTHELRSFIENALGERVSLRITDNRRTMIASNRDKGTRKLRLHHMFLSADAGTVRSLVRYLKRSDRVAQRELSQFIDRHRDKIRVELPALVHATPQGRCFDLQALFNRVNETHFNGTIDASVRWGTRTRAKRRYRRRTIKLGTYSWETKLIRIHPALDQPWVPEFFIEYIIFHEMLHHVIPGRVVGGKHRYHTAEFRARERSFPRYAEAIHWEKQNIHRLLSAK